jgi:hypothetical protein
MDTFLAYFPKMEDVMCATCKVHALYKMHNPGCRLLDFMQAVTEQLTASTAPVEGNRTNDCVTPRTCDIATSTTAGPSNQAHHHVKRTPKKDPA